MVANLSNAGVKVPNGFATTSFAFNQFLETNQLNDRIYQLLDALDVDDVNALKPQVKPSATGYLKPHSPFNLKMTFVTTIKSLSNGDDMLSVAVRSSATAEDLPDASFAGQQETFLNVRGIDAIIEATKHVFASLFNDRAISYRVHQGFDHKGVALSAGIQRMVRSDKAASGVMFTLDTESGFDQVVLLLLLGV